MAILPWADTVHNLSLPIGGVDFIWMPTPASIRDADLVILLQENRLLSNFPYLLRRHFGGPLVAFWGHGVNLKSTHPNGARERFRRFQLSQADHFFAYTQATAELVARAGYPADRITIVENAIDSEAFRRDYDAVEPDALSAARRALGIESGAPVALFCGSLYANRRLSMLIASMDLVRQALPDLHLIVIGTGPELPVLEAAAASRPWLHLVGPKFGPAKAVLFRLAQILVNPGAVGLVVLDSFTAGVPLVTTRHAFHGPEIAYLRNGQNGVLCDDTAESFAAAVARILSDPAYRALLAQGGLADSKLYSAEAMAQNLVGGIVTCLRQGRYVPRSRLVR
jgi:glycosyltransferase involved in cell wall biosynthesis